MSYGSTMQFMRTGTSASCGPTAAPAIAGAASSATLYPYGFRGVATPTKARTTRQRAAYAGNGFMPLERMESAVSSFANKALNRVTAAITPMDLRMKTQARQASASASYGLCYDTESGRVWQKGTDYWENATLLEDFGTHVQVDVYGIGPRKADKCPGYGRTQPWRTKQLAAPRQASTNCFPVLLDAGPPPTWGTQCVDRGTSLAQPSPSARGGQLPAPQSTQLAVPKPERKWNQVLVFNGPPSRKFLQDFQPGQYAQLLSHNPPGVCPPGGLVARVYLLDRSPEGKYVYRTAYATLTNVEPVTNPQFNEVAYADYAICKSPRAFASPEPAEWGQSAKAKKQNADAIRLSSGSGSTRAPSLATFDPRAVLLRRQASAIAGSRCVSSGPTCPKGSVYSAAHGCCVKDPFSFSARAVPRRSQFAPFDPRQVYARDMARAKGVRLSGVSTGFAGAGCGASYYAGGCGCTGR